MIKLDCVIPKVWNKIFHTAISETWGKLAFEDWNLVEDNIRFQVHKYVIEEVMFMGYYRYCNYHNNAISTHEQYVILFEDFDQAKRKVWEIWLN